MTILEAVRALTVGDCPTRREAVKRIREYFEDGDPLERIKEEIKQYEEEDAYEDFDKGVNYAIMRMTEIIDKYRETQAERSGEE